MRPESSSRPLPVKATQSRNLVLISLKIPLYRGNVSILSHCISPEGEAELVLAAVPDRPAHHAHVVRPRPRVEDVEVGVPDGRAERLVGQVGRPPRQRRQPPLEVARRRVAPRARVTVERALHRELLGVLGQGCEGTIVANQDLTAQ